MKSNSRTCPQCSTRNRLEREFCVKCGEPLAAVPQDEVASPPGKGKAGIVVLGDRDFQSPVVPAVLLGLTVIVAIAGWQYLRANPAPPLPQTASRPEPVTPAPVATPPVGTPGVEEYSAGIAALRAGDFTNAVRLLREAVQLADRSDYRAGLAEALEKAGDTDASLDEYERAARQGPGNARYAAEWARALNRAGRTVDAVRAYDVALGMDANNVALLREVSGLLLKSPTIERAGPYLQRIIQLQPEDLVPKQDLARVLEASNDLNGAAEQYRGILTLMPLAHLVRSQLAEVLFKQNKPADALALLDEGLRDNAGAALLHRERGRVLDRMGRDQEAVVAYREYLRLSPAAADARTFRDRIAQLVPRS